MADRLEKLRESRKDYYGLEDWLTEGDVDFIFDHIDKLEADIETLAQSSAIKERLFNEAMAKLENAQGEIDRLRGIMEHWGK